MDETKEVESLLRRGSRQAVVWALVLSSMISTPLLAAQTDISSTPITSSNAAQVKPNIMLLMDTSASMGWAYMPDEAGYQVVGGSSVSVLGPGPNNGPQAKIGFKAAQCNIVYYNRNQTYELPKKPNGDRFDQPDFGNLGAPFDGFDPGSAKVKLDAAFRAYETGLLQFSNRNDVARPAYYYYRTGGPAITAFNSPACLDDDADVSLPSYDPNSGTPDGGTWNRVVVSTTSGIAPHVNELNNFATWFSFYRTRMLLIKSAASLAFTPLTDSFRVGFITVSPKETGTSTPPNLDAQAPINQDKYLAIDDFTSVQRGLWYGKLFSQKPSGTSPTREGLARVGRHYAGKHDGINTGMAGDPVQFSCQQNFTIMTTDGYWNTQDESTQSGGFIGGPVDNSGKTLVGQRDGNLDSLSTNNPSPAPATDVNVTPRPIWDGTFDGLRTVKNRTVHNDYTPCGTYFNKTTTAYFKSTTQLRKEVTQKRKVTHQVLLSSVQNLQTTSQLFKQTLQSRMTTTQTLMSTHQALANTTQKLKTTTQRLQSTQQHRQATNQNLYSSFQTLKSTLQYTQVKKKLAKYVYIPRQTTRQTLQSTNQTKKQTTQVVAQTLQHRQTTIANTYYTDTVYKSTSQSLTRKTRVEKSTAQNLQSTLQHLRTQRQTLQSTSQTSYSTFQWKQSTSQLTVSTVQKRKSTYQLNSCRSEVCTPVPVGTCVSGGGVVCQPAVTGPTLVAECAPEDPAEGNSYTRTLCDVRPTGPTGVPSCNNSDPGPGNSYIRTSCNTLNTGPTAVLTCTNSGANGNNSYVATTCTPVTTGPMYAPANCADQAPTDINSYVKRTCTTVPTGPVGVDKNTCIRQDPLDTNDYKTITCTQNDQVDVPVQTCNESPAGDGNGWTATTCRDAVTTNVPVASCTNSGATGLNQWTATSCTQPTSGPTIVDPATCTGNIAAVDTNQYTATTCNTINVDTAAVSTSCSTDPASGSNGWIATSCRTVPTGPTAVLPSNCVEASAGDGNQWTSTSCPTTTAGPFPYAATACFSNGFYNTTSYYRCQTATYQDFNDKPVASCSIAYPFTDPYLYTTCRDVTGPEVPQAPPCNSIPADGTNAYTATTCNTKVSPLAPAQSCNPDPTPTSLNSFTTTACVPNNTVDKPVQFCTYIGPTVDNSWTETTCRQNDQVNTAVNSCTPSIASNPNWVSTTCPAETLQSGPVYVATCGAVPASDGNGHQRTDCVWETQSTVAMLPGTCTTEDPSPGNGQVTTTCETVTTSQVGVDLCSPADPVEGNNYVQTICTPNNHVNIPLAATCVPQTRGDGNQWTQITCPAPNVTGPTPVLACNPIPPLDSNFYTSTYCLPDAFTGPTGVDVCTPHDPDNSNDFKKVTCTDNNPTPYGVDPATCSNQTRGDTNQWIQITCNDDVRTNVPVASCTVASAKVENQWIATTCPAPIDTTPVGVQTCVNQPLALQANNYVTTLCTPNNTDVPSGTCVAQSASGGLSGNAWTRTDCPIIDSGFNGTDTCKASAANDQNAWTITNCDPRLETDKPVGSCFEQQPNDANHYQTITCRQVLHTNEAAQSCSAGDAGSGNSYTKTTCTPVDTDVASGDCVASSARSDNSWTTTTCPTVIISALDGAPDCTAATGSDGNQWTTTSCPGVLTVPPYPSAPCTGTPADGTNHWTASICTSQTSTTTLETACNAGPAAPGNGYIATTCVPLSGQQKTVTTTTSSNTFQVSGGNQSGPSNYTISTAGPTAVGQCYAPGTAPALDPDGVDAWTSADASANPTCSGWPCTVDVNVDNPRSINSLADVSQYYYVTDLRAQSAGQYTGAQWALQTPDLAHASDDVPGVNSGPEDDRVRWQHMTTFSIALGVSGTLQYQQDYKQSTTGDFAKLRCANPLLCQQLNWPLWPVPTPGYYTTDGQPGSPLNDNLYSDPRSIDDFWHAAVNGRGTYFSAGDPTSVIAGLSNALAGITSRVASSTGAGTSNLEPVPGDNYVFLANYATSKWVGDVQSHEIDVSSGAIQTPIIWSAKTLLDQAVGAACDNRNIFLFRNGATNNLVDFSLNTKSCNSTGQPTGSARTGLNGTEQGYFGLGNVQLLSQYPSMTGSSDPVDQKSAAVGANLVNYLRGQRGEELFQAGIADRLFRQRDNVLGDIVDGQPVYVRAPFASFADAGYAAYKALPAVANRKPMLYVAANDGMLHAFSAGTSANAGLGADGDGGKELWAVIPTTVLPNLFLLADNNYKNLHRYYVDGTPTVSDAKLGTDWKTLLVGGLNSGGRGYYALDVTDPQSPKGLWEFKLIGTCYDGSPGTASLGGDCHLGLTFGKPIITKLADGRWVVMVTSGYNNVNATPIAGDGVGYLYVLNAATGTILYKISTGVGSAGTPSGLAQINNYVENADQDNTTVRVYGTDVLGNIWRFDVNDNTAPTGREATLLATATDGTPANLPQPITTRPEISSIGNKPMLFVATGKLFGATDVADLQKQSIYGIIDPITSSPYTGGNTLRGQLAPLALTQPSGQTYRTVRCTGSTAACGSTNGWFVDLPDPGERVNVEMKLRSYTLIVGSNVPQISACSAGGYSWLNYFNYQTGLSVVGANNLSVSQSVANSLIVGLTVVKLSDGTIKAIVTTSDAGVLSMNPPTHAQPLNAKRISWREVVTQ